MKKNIFLLTIFLTAFQSSILSQRLLTEGVITYNLSVTTTTKEPELADVFDGALLNVYIKGTQVASELKSALLNQVILYDGKNTSAVILKESGDQKFIIHLTSDNWLHYNRKYEGVFYTFLEETKTITGYPCKKAIGKLKDGTEFTVYYATTLIPSVKGYDYQFKSLPGMAMEYEVQNGGIKVKYTATKVTLNPVPAAKFDIPQKGYRILDYKVT